MIKTYSILLLFEIIYKVSSKNLTTSNMSMRYFFMQLIVMSLTIEIVHGSLSLDEHKRENILSKSSDTLNINYNDIEIKTEDLPSTYVHNNQLQLNIDYDTHMQKIKEVYDSMQKEDIIHSLVMLLFIPLHIP